MLNRKSSYRFAIAIIALVSIGAISAAANWAGFTAFSFLAPAETAVRAESVPPPARPLATLACDTGNNVDVEATAGTLQTGYANLSAAIAAINAGTHQGVISIEICASTTELTSDVLNSNAAAPASYTSVNIYPLVDGLTISGPTTTGRGLIELNGADNVTIDGDNPLTGGTNRNLTITNTAAVTVNLTSVIRIAVLPATVASADNNTFRNLNINGSAVGRNAAANTSTTNSENSSFGIYAGGLATGATTAPAVLTSVSTNTASAATTINAFNATNNAVDACARGIFFNGSGTAISTGVTITNNTVGGAGVLAGAPPYIAPTTTVYTKPIFVAGTTAVSITGNTIQNILSYVGTTMNGIELNANIGSGGVNISNNTINGVVNNGTSAANGIALTSSASAPVVASNTVTNIQAVGGATVAGIILNTTNSGATAEKNRVTTVYSRGSGGFGAYGINVNSGGAWNLRNNMVTDVNAFLNNGTISTAFGPHGIRVVTGSGHKIFNNSVNLFGAFVGSSSLSMASALTLINSASTGMDVRNNILVNTMTGAPVGTPVNCIYLPAALTVAFNLTDNNNDYFSSAQLAQQGITAVSGFTVVDFDPGSTVGATNWRSYTSTLSAPGTNDDASIKLDPLFVSTADLHLTAGSPARDVGAIIGDVTNDIDNQLRPGANAFFDIGADEFDGVAPPANDLQGTAFLDPTNGGLKIAGVAFSPQASFTNNGTAAQTSVTVRYRICTDGTCTTEIYNNTAVIASIASFATANVTFPSTTIGTPGTYTTKARSELAGDSVAGNDEITGTVIIQAPLAGSYTVGGGGNYPSLTNAGGIFEALNGLGASGAVTINITSDLAGETGAFPLNPIAGNPAVLIKPSGAPRTISGIAPIAVIRINGADNIRIDGSTAAAVVGGTPALRELTVQNLSTSTSSAVIAIGSASESSTGNTIQNVNVLGNDPTQTLLGIGVGGGTPGTAATFPNNNTRILNCSVRRALFGIFSSGVVATPTTGTVISENDLTGLTTERIRRVGILVFNEDGVQITQNSIAGINTTESADAIGIGVGTQGVDTTGVTSGGVSNANVNRNKIDGVNSASTIGFSAAGIAVAGGTLGANVISNNMITGVTAPATAPDIVTGIFVRGVVGSTTRVFYNAVSMTGDRDPLVAGQTPSFGIGITGTDPTVELKNNIFYTTQTASGGGVNAESYAVGTQSAAFVNLDSNYNVFYSAGANAGFFRTGSLADAAGTDHADIAAWRVATGGGATDDFNSAEGDPNFVNPLTDLHIQIVSPLTIDMGIAVSVLDDFDGSIRSVVGFAGGIPDIGGDERIGPSAADASIGGRVTTANGQGIRNAVIVVTGNSLPQPIFVRTGSFGYYKVEGLEVGETYVVTVVSKRFMFSSPSRVISLTDSITDADFVADPHQ